MPLLLFHTSVWKTQEIAIKGKTKSTVTLSDDTKALDEVVVIGYGQPNGKISQVPLLRLVPEY